MWDPSKVKELPPGPPATPVPLKNPIRVDAHRQVDFVKAVPMHDERGMEVRIDRAIVGRSVNRESAAKVASIVLDGDWFEVLVATGTEATTGAMARTYRVPLSNVVSAER